jgi:hypothetical protein
MVVSWSEADAHDPAPPKASVNTNPPGADCSLAREGLVIGRVNPTPGSVVVQKTKHDIQISCAKPGYQEATYYDHSGVAGATWGNIIAGGPIGWAIDSASGADNKYDSPVNLTLVPVVAEMQSPPSVSTPPLPQPAGTVSVQPATATQPVAPVVPSFSTPEPVYQQPVQQAPQKAVLPEPPVTTQVPASAPPISAPATTTPADGNEIPF